MTLLVTHTTNVASIKKKQLLVK